MGLELFVERVTDRLPTVTAVKVPEGVDWKAISDYAMKKYVYSKLIFKLNNILYDCFF